MQQSILIFNVPTNRFIKNTSTTLTIYKHSAYGLKVKHLVKLKMFRHTALKLMIFPLVSHESSLNTI